MNAPMTRTAPKLIDTFNGIKVFDARNTISMEGMKPGDMYIAQVLLDGELYAMRINGNGRLVGIASDLSALQAFDEVVSRIESTKATCAMVSRGF